MLKRLIIWTLILTSTLENAKGQQVADTSYRFPILSPAYNVAKGPVILFDQFHNNPFTLKGQYSAFTRLLSDDGYVLTAAKEKITAELLRKTKIYVTVNAMFDPMNWDRDMRSAYSDQEIDALDEWVRDGGSLFLVTDHMPCGASAQSIARRFSFNIMNGFAHRKDRQPEIFSRKNNNLREHAITTVQGARIDSIMVFSGSGFVVPPEASVISTLGADYNIYMPEKASHLTGDIPDTIPAVSGIGFANGASMQVGKGRIVLFADASPFSAQLEGIKSNKRGMNHPAAGQNAQFLLNIIHWLDGRL